METILRWHGNNCDKNFDHLCDRKITPVVGHKNQHVTNNPSAMAPARPSLGCFTQALAIHVNQTAVVNMPTKEMRITVSKDISRSPPINNVNKHAPANGANVTNSPTSIFAENVITGEHGSANKVLNDFS